ncbi:MAG: hypothetical protein JNM57_05515 [Cyclobacteriaceae bacterium]|nr:hypothetical protein [Cyclobacteriaceae bacterium]
MIKVIVVGLLIISMAVFFGTYEAFTLSYYEEQKAERYSDYAVAPFMIYFFIAFFIERYKYSLKINRLFDAVKQSLLLYTSVILFYLILIRSVVSGFIIFTNDVFGSKQEIAVNGIVMGKVDIRGPKGGNFEYDIKTENEIFRFDTDGVQINKYQIGDSFNERMSIGFWGLLSKDR